MQSQACRSAVKALLILPPLVSGAPLERSLAAGLHSDMEAACPSAEGSSECRDAQLSLLQSAVNPLGFSMRAFRARRARTKAAAGRHAAVSDLSDLVKAGLRDLALVHIPYNFGHIVENVAMFGGPNSMLEYLTSVGLSEVKRQASWDEARGLVQPFGEIWGHLNPDLQVTSEVTGCPMYYTPQKYWPEGLAAKYFGNRTRFGMLRDPYERLVAFFRGSLKGFGGDYPEFVNSCNVNDAVMQMLQNYTSGNRFANVCTLLPQAEFFDGPYGIDLPIDNRLFPQSMNEAFMQHGYPDLKIKRKAILHLTECPNVWAADLDARTRALVKEIYARDFELLCKHFGYCDKEENACVYQIPQMCPQRVMDMGYRGRSLNLTS